MVRKSFFATGIVTLAVLCSGIANASSVTIPNAFTSGTKAVAAEVNANFSAVKGAVDDNDARVTTNAAGIATNAGDIATNQGNINTNTNNITTNQGNINTNTNNITALQSSSGCPATDSNGNALVQVGSLCVFKYEASVTNAAGSGGTQYGVSAADYPCAADGSDCGAAGAFPIYAHSVASVIPSSRITWYQAVQACANAGMRLPTTAEWLAAAAGTPDSGTGSDGSAGCNTDGGGKINTGAAVGCTSTAGVADMAGNVREMAAELDRAAAPNNTTTDATKMRLLGAPFDSTASSSATSIKALFIGDGPTVIGNVYGFRCVR